MNANAMEEHRALGSFNSMSGEGLTPAPGNQSFDEEVAMLPKWMSVHCRKTHRNADEGRYDAIFKKSCMW
eukprot:4526405-Prorocentrum_lima.AAC.1